MAPWLTRIFEGGPEIEHGYALPPAAPGLGIRLNEEQARTLEKQGPAPPPELMTYRDGAPAEV